MEKKTEFRGTQAIEYAKTHLRKVKVIPDRWETEFEDPVTGESWLLDNPQSEFQGGGEVAKDK